MAALSGTRARRAALAAALAAAQTCAVACSAPPSAGSAPRGAWRVYRGAADASGFAFLDAGTIVVADDEDDALRIYDAASGGMPRARVELGAFLGDGKDGESDLEAAASAGDRIYWVSSHGPDKKGRLRPERRRFFATDVVRGAGAPTVRPVGVPCSVLHEALAVALAAAVAGNATGAEALEIEALAPIAGGGGLWIGLRAPRAAPAADGGARRAVVVPFENPDDVVERGAPPRLGTPALLDLDGGSLRGMEPLADGGGYAILAGPAGGPEAPALFVWDGDAGHAPRRVPFDLPAGMDGAPEALAAVPGAARLLVLSDDGGVRVPAGAGACRRGKARKDGSCENKHLADPARRTFRGFEIPAPDAVGPGG